MESPDMNTSASNPSPWHAADRETGAPENFGWLIFWTTAGGMAGMFLVALAFFKWVPAKARPVFVVVTYGYFASGFTHKAWKKLSSDKPSKYFYAAAAFALIMTFVVAAVDFCVAKMKGQSVPTWWKSLVNPLYAVKYLWKLPENPRESFIKIHEMLYQEILDDIAQDHESSREQLAWVEEMLKHNTIGGTMDRGMRVVDVLRAFATSRGKKLTHAEVCRGSVLGWAIEWLQASFLVADDVMNKSPTRSGQPSWYKVSKVQEVAINDSFMLEAQVYKILKWHFGDEDYYVQLVELFHDAAYRREMGRLLDLRSQPKSGPMNLKRFTLERYRAMVRNTTAFYAFYYPYALGMIFSGVKDPASYKLAREICCRIGELLHIQDDYLDCYGDPDVIGKVGTDIQDTKCSWLIVQALERASPKQRKLLEDNYGVDDQQKIDRVKEIYREIGLERLYWGNREKVHAEIKELIAKVENTSHAVFHQFVDKVYEQAI